MAQVRIESIAAGGDGVGRLDGLAVFIPRTGPGELVEASIRQRGRMARGRLLRVLEASGDRVAPRCVHYDGDRCGGCQVQHLSIDAQHVAKQRIVQDAFTRIAKRRVDLAPLVPSVSDWEYRSRLTLAMRWERGHWIMGLHTFDNVDQVFDLRECPITNRSVVSAWSEVRNAARFLPRTAELRGTVRLAGDQLTLVIEGGASWPGAREFAQAVPSFAVIRWRPADAAPRVILDRRTARTPDEAFDQVNEPVAAAARDELVQRALSVSPRSVVDAYAGLGATSRALAERGIVVTAIEVDNAAAKHAASHLPVESRVIAGRVEDHLDQCLPTDVVILNPPRAGIDARVAEVLNAPPRPKLVLYMSCDPATLARDVSRMPAYRVTSVRAYDMFPQTAHVEVVCALTPEDA